MSKSIKNRVGFTIIEMIMATAVFSTVLLLGLTGFIQVGRMFYKGVTIAQTRDSARDTLDSVTSDIKLASSVSTAVNTGTNQYFICIGNHRYSANLFNKITTLSDDDGATTGYGLKRETLPGSAGCDGTTTPVNPSSSPELLGNRMRLLKFDVTPLSADVYNVTIRVAYGEDDDLTDPTSPNAECKGSTVSTQFCSVTELNTKVFKGI